MGRKPRYFDNIFIESLCRIAKYKCVYVHSLETKAQIKARFGHWNTFY